MKAVVLLSLIAVLILGLGVFIYLNYPEITIDGFEQNSITFQQDSFIINADLLVMNKGIIPIKFKQAEYDVYLESNNIKLGDGFVPGKKLNAGEITQLNINQKLNWTPTLELVLDILDKGNTNIIIKGKIVIFTIGKSEVSVPFQEQIDIEEYLEQFLVEKTKDYFDNPEEVIGTVKETGKKILDIVSNII